MCNLNDSNEKSPVPASIAGENVTDAAQQRVVAATNLNLILPGNDADVNTPGKDDTTMNNNFRHGFYTLGSIYSERILCDADEMFRLTWKNQGILVGREAYLSALTYPDEFVDFVNENIRKNGTAKHCTRGYDGPCGANYLLVDIDRKNNLQAAFDDMVGFVENLEKLGLSRENVILAASGGKGGHFYIPMPVFGEATKPSVTFNTECKKVAVALAAGIEIDLVIYDKNRLFRGLNSLRPETRRYKICVTADELAAPNCVEAITSRATRPRLLVDTTQEECPDTDAVRYTPPTEPVGKLVDLWYEATKTPPRYHQGWSPGYNNQSRHGLRKDTKNFIVNGVPEGTRATDMYKAAADCINVGLEESDVKMILSSVGEKIGLEPKEANRQIKCGIEKAKRDASLQQDTDDWQDTNLRDPATFQDFPLECLPEPVSRYVREKANALNQNPSGLAYALLVLAGACVGAKVKLKLGNDRLAAAILWFALIGISGSGKTPLINACVALVSEMESIWHKQYVKEMRVYEREKAEYERSLKSKTVLARAGNEECVHVQPPSNPSSGNSPSPGQPRLRGYTKTWKGTPAVCSSFMTSWRRGSATSSGGIVPAPIRCG